MVRRAWGLLILSTGLIGSCASSTIVNPSWATLPDPEALASEYPVFAAMAGLEGDATLNCAVTPDGRLARCRSVTTIPKGVGFDRAALAMTDRYRLNPQQVDGAARKAAVQFTTRFRMGGIGTPEPWTGPEPSSEELAAAGRLVADMERAMGGRASFATRPLDVDADREAEVRAMVIAVDETVYDRETEDMVLSFARRLTVEQMNFIVTRRGPPPPPPSEEVFEEALMGGMTVERSRKLRTLYCARYDCSPPTAGPAGS